MVRPACGRGQRYNPASAMCSLFSMCINFAAHYEVCLFFLAALSIEVLLSVAQQPANEIECQLQQQLHTILWSLWGGLQNESSTSRSCQQFSNTWEKERVKRYAFGRIGRFIGVDLSRTQWAFFPRAVSRSNLWSVFLSLRLYSNHCGLQIFKINFDLDCKSQDSFIWMMAHQGGASARGHKAHVKFLGAHQARAQSAQWPVRACHRVQGWTKNHN